MTMTNEQYTEWLFNPTTVAIREKLHIQRSAWQELLSVGETIEDSPGNTAMRTARMVGKIEGLDEFLNLQYPKDETINRGED